MPNTYNVQDVDVGLKIGVRESNSEKGEPRWYSIHYNPSAQGAKQEWRSLGMIYRGGRGEARRAIQLAREKHQVWIANTNAGKSEDRFSLTFESVRKSYLEYYKEKADINEELVERGAASDELIRVENGRGTYTESRYQASKTLLEDRIQPFFDELSEKSILKIKTIDLNRFTGWAQKEYEWSPSRIARAITEIRMVYNYALDRDMITSIPVIRRPLENLKERRRRCFTEVEYNRFIENIETNYRLIKPERYPTEEAYLAKKDKWFQFLCFVQFVAYMGFRPPTGQTKKNLMRWDCYHKWNEGTENESRTFRRFNEKNHTYDAIIMPQIWSLWDSLDNLYKLRGIETPYVFTYTFDKGFVRAGDPILNFRNEWRLMLKATGLYTDAEERSERLTPYSLRSFYISMRLRYGDVSINRLADIVGSSIRMVQQAYDDFSAEKEFDRLSKAGGEYRYENITDKYGSIVL